MQSALPQPRARPCTPRHARRVRNQIPRLAARREVKTARVRRSAASAWMDSRTTRRCSSQSAATSTTSAASGSTVRRARRRRPRARCAARTCRRRRGSPSVAGACLCLLRPFRRFCFARPLHLDAEFCSGGCWNLAGATLRVGARSASVRARRTTRATALREDRLSARTVLRRRRSASGNTTSALA
jgi:hypothetical protein